MGCRLTIRGIESLICFIGGLSTEKDKYGGGEKRKEVQKRKQ